VRQVILGVGVDVVDLDRFREVLGRRPGVADRLFTSGERAYADSGPDPVPRLAVRFAAKEAVMKALGVGVGPVGWHDVEVERDPEGRPSVVLHGRAAALAATIGVERWDLALTHGDLVAQATAVAQGPAWSGGSWARPTWADPRVLPLGAGGLPIGGGLVPIVTPEEMARIDRDAPEPVEVLIGRAGSAVARAAVELLGGTYGRRVVVLTGKGNNGNDGRDAARRLRRRGVRVREVDVSSWPTVLPDADLVIDAAFGTGFRGTYAAPETPPGTPVLAVDIPSGVDGLTGSLADRVMPATATVTFAALKPGLVLPPGAGMAGDVRVADIGLDVSGANAHLVGAAGVARWLPRPSPTGHKWQRAVWIVAGSPGMGGAAALCSAAAARSGAGYVRLSTPGGHPVGAPVEAVLTDLPARGWAAEVLDGLDRFAALVVGNGLGTSPDTAAEVRELVAGAAALGLPTVVDADGLTALGTDAGAFVGATTVLTPHDGEFARLAGGAPGTDRLDAARRLSAATGAVVLLKGPATVVASPDGAVLVSTTGDERLATAGTGDVLAGLVGGLLAQGVVPALAAAAGAFLHGRAGALGWERGLVAGDLPGAVPAALAEVADFLP
jgi:NAD(P)H-hydrate epimerase